MNKTIFTHDNLSVEVETDGELWGFKASDIITYDCHKGLKRIFIIEGFEFEDDKLWGTARDESEKKSNCTSTPDGLILLERPGWKFKVGNEVRAIMGGSVKAGKIVVINPYEYEDLPFLVEFENFVGGRDGSASWKKPWYPNRYKTKSDSRWWTAEDDLEFLSENT